MLIILIMFVLAIIITFLFSLDDPDYMLPSAITCTLIIGVLLTIIWGMSYGSYIGMRSSYDIVITQYKDSVTMYADRAVLDVKGAALTDFKYEGYQNNIANFIRDLRRRVVRYNTNLIEKRTMKKNLFFRWLIVAPDEDMKIINLKD